MGEERAPPAAPGAAGEAPGVQAATVVAAAILAAIGLVHLGFSVRNGTVGVIADDAVYLLLADALGRFFGHAAPGAGFVWGVNQFPPLYPLLLGILGANSAHLVAAHSLTAGCTLGAGFVFQAWLMARGWSRCAATGLAAAWMLLPQSLFASIEVLSEPLYVLLSLAALLAMHRESVGRGPWWRAAVVVAAATLTRSVGLALLGAYLVWLWRARRPARRLATAVAVLPALAWNVLSAGLRPGGHGYLGDLADRYEGKPLTSLMRHLFEVAPRAIFEGWIRLFDISHLAAFVPVTIAVLVLAVAGVARRCAQREADGIYTALYIALIWVWPYPEHAARFLWPLAPLLLLHAAETARALAHHLALPRARALGFVLLCVLGGTTLPSWAHFVTRLNLPLPAELAAFRGSQIWLDDHSTENARHNARAFHLMNASMRVAADFIPAGACVFSVHPEQMMFYARRASRAPPLPFVGDARFAKAIRGCGYVHALLVRSHPAYPPGYPRVRLSNAESLFLMRAPFGNRSAAIAELFAVH